MVDLAMRVSELLRNRGVVESIVTTPRQQYRDDRLVSLLGCRGLSKCGPLNTVGGM